MAVSGSGGTGGSGIRRVGGDLPALGSRYKIVKRLGRGGQGDVWLAHDTVFNLPVAIKVLHAEFRDEETVGRLKLEAQTAVRLGERSVNIVRIYQYDAEYPYLVMEYCDGGDLAGYIKSRRRRSVTELIGLVRQILEALVVAHEDSANVVHRDMKPANVLFKNGVAKICDFGLAKALSGAPGMTTTRGMIGTWAYASPEQTRDAKLVDHRTDIWAVGVILYELLAWRRPFDCAGDDATMVAIHVRVDPPAEPPYEIPQPLMDVIRIALQKDPSQRFGSAREFLLALNQALAAIPDPDGLLLPPESAVDEESRKAADLASLLEGRQIELAVSRLHEVNDPSIRQYFDKQIRRIRSESQSNRPVEPVQPDPFDSRVTVVESAIRHGNYGRARDLVGGMLDKDPNSQMALRLLRKIQESEKQYREEVNRAYDDAEEARGRGGLQKVFEIWRNFAERYPESEDAKRKLAVAKAEWDEAERWRRRQKVEQEAKTLEAAGKLDAAIPVWTSYLEAYPQDQEAATERSRIERALSLRQREQRLAALRSDARRKQDAGDLPGALATWDQVLREDPTAADARQRCDALRREIDENRRANSFRAVSSDVSKREAQGDFEGAIGLWRRHTADFPDDVQARSEISRLENARAQVLVAAARKHAERAETRVSRKIDGGRYRALDAARQLDLSRALEAVGQSASKSLGAMEHTLRDLVTEEKKSEKALSDALGDSRSGLLGSIERARAFSQSGDEQVLGTLGNAEAALSAAGAPGDTADPVAPLAAARKALDTAISEATRRREAALKQARAGAAEAAAAAKTAVKTLELCVGREEAGSRLGTLDWLNVAVQELDESRARALADRAEALRAKADAGRCVALLQLVRDGRELLAAAMILQLSYRVPRIDEVCGQLAPALDTPDSAPSFAKLPALVRELRGLVDTSRVTVAERMAKAKAAWEAALDGWKQLLSQELNVEWQAKAEEIRAAAVAATIGSQIRALEIRTLQLISLTRWCRLQCRWIADGPGLEDAEGGVGSDGLPLSAPDPETLQLLVDYRSRLAAGNLDELPALTRTIVARSGSESRAAGPRGSEKLRIPPVSAAMRKFNKKFYAAGLQRFDQLAVKAKGGSGAAASRTKQTQSDLDAAYDALLPPRPAWQRALPIFGPVLALIAAAAVWTAIPKGTYDVTIMSAQGDVAIKDLQRNGTTVGAKSPSVGEVPVHWRLERGTYTLVTGRDSKITFEVPSDQPILVVDNADRAAILLDALGVGETHSGQRP